MMATAIAKAAPPAVRRRRALQDRAELLVARQVRTAIRLLRATIDPAPLARAIGQFGPLARLPVLPLALFAARLRRHLLRFFRDTYEAAGEGAARDLQRRLLGKDEAFQTQVSGFGFEVLNPRGLEYLQRYGADRVKQIDDDTRAAMRRLLGDMHQEGVPPLQQAQRLKAYIGLIPAHEQAVSNLRARLLDDGVAPPRVAILEARKVRQLTELRALTIARTESAFAAAAGARESLAQAVDAELLDPAQASRVWRTSADELASKCDICGPMDGQVSPGLNGTFTTGDGEETDDAPAHPNCRCTTELVI